ncbi:MAG: hypothetical protein SF339_01730 [Blastocatellia bacterium]|nr:hypothetical protein [Blastocatellia bacterium]
MKQIFYHANFCAECGNPIERRLRWRPIHFCAECDARLGRRLPLSALVVVLCGASLLVSALHRRLPPAAPSARDAILAPRAPRASDTPVGIASPTPTAFCGARTKKGTPCKHRTPPGQRCAQHRGRPAM